MSPDGCSVPDCTRAHAAFGLCMTHYRQLKRRGEIRAVQVKDGTATKVDFRCSAALKAAIDAAAEAAGVDRGEWLRSVVEAALKR